LIGKLQEAIVRDHALDARDACVEIRDLDLHGILFGGRCAAGKHQEHKTGARRSETPHGP